MADKRPKCKCGRRMYPDRPAAQRAAGRGSRQCDNREIQCVPYTCPHGNHHVILHPRGIRPTYCACGLITPTPTGSLILLEYLTGKHPDDTNPYVMFRCRHAAAHVARRSTVPDDADTVPIPPPSYSRPT